MTPYAMTRLDALRKLRREGYHVVDDDLWRRHVAGRADAIDLWARAEREHPDDHPARLIRYIELMIEHGHIEQLEHATPVTPGGSNPAVAGGQSGRSAADG